MRHLITTTLLAGAVVLGLGNVASAGNSWNAPGLNGSSLQGNGFNGASFQGNSYNGSGLQGNGLNGASFQGNSYNGRGLQGNGLNAVAGDTVRRHVSPKGDTTRDAKTAINVPRHGLRLNGVILADPAASTD